MNTDCDLLVIGGGLTGLSAAYHASLRGAQVLCIEASGTYGGLVANVSALEDMPGQEGTPGIAFADALAERCRRQDVQFQAGAITALAASPSGFTATGPDGTIRARKVILASGAELRRLGIPGERELEHRGVSTCAWCDGGLFRGQRVAVVGGGDSALQAALYLADLCSAVDVVVRGDLTARRSYVTAAADRDTIAFHWDTEIQSIDGAEAVESVTVREEGRATAIPCTAVFLYAGLVPNGSLAPSGAERDAEGALVTDTDGRTAIPGFFAAGAVRSEYRGQGVNALSEGALAAVAAAKELEE